jgi:hypothetical protein
MVTAQQFKALTINSPAIYGGANPGEKDSFGRIFDIRNAVKNKNYDKTD